MIKQIQSVWNDVKRVGAHISFYSFGGFEFFSVAFSTQNILAKRKLPHSLDEIEKTTAKFMMF